jgi:hypothetical protein
MVLPDPWLPSDEMNEVAAVATLTGVASGTIVGTNNDGLYVPVVFPCDATLYALRIAGTNTSGNYDLGLYDAALNRIASKGSTAMAATVLELTLADIRVRAGQVYYAAAAFSNTAATIIRVNWAAGGWQRGAGFGLQASAVPLPNPAVPTTVGTIAVAPVFAFGVR